MLTPVPALSALASRPKRVISGRPRYYEARCRRRGGKKLPPTRDTLGVPAAWNDRSPHTSPEVFRGFCWDERIQAVRTSPRSANGRDCLGVGAVALPPAHNRTVDELLADFSLAYAYSSLWLGRVKVPRDQHTQTARANNDDRERTVRAKGAISVLTVVSLAIKARC